MNEKPTPEEKCSHDWIYTENGNIPKCRLCGVSYAVKIFSTFDKPSPSHEARVDWEKDVKGIAKRMNNSLHGELCDIMPSIAEDSEQPEWTVGELQVMIDRFWRIVTPSITIALSAAFEKGREAR